MKHWHALYTKPKKEHQVNALLRARGIETYLPTVRRKVKRRDRPERIVYFPCYLFARFDFRAIPPSSIAWMPGIRRIVTSGDEPAVVADGVVDLIRRRLDGAEIYGHGNLRRGDRVRITSGPLRHLEAVFDRPLAPADRVQVLLSVMGSTRPVSIDCSQIAPI